MCCFVRDVLYGIFCTCCSVRVVMYVLFCTCCYVRVVLYMLFYTWCSVRVVMYMLLCTCCSVRVVRFVLFCTCFSIRDVLYVLLCSGCVLSIMRAVWPTYGQVMSPVVVCYVRELCACPNTYYIIGLYYWLLSQLCQSTYRTYLYLTLTVTIRFIVIRP